MGLGESREKHRAEASCFPPFWAELSWCWRPFPPDAWRGNRDVFSTQETEINIAPVGLLSPGLLMSPSKCDKDHVPPDNHPSGPRRGAIWMVLANYS